MHIIFEIVLMSCITKLSKLDRACRNYSSQSRGVFFDGTYTKMVEISIQPFCAKRHIGAYTNT